MSGERDLARLLAGLDPDVAADPYVFTQAPDGAVPAGVRPFATVAEDELQVLPRAVVAGDDAQVSQS